MKSQQVRDCFAGPVFFHDDRLIPREPISWARAFALSRALMFAAITVGAGIVGYDVIAPTPAVSSVTPTDLRPTWIEVTRATGAFAVSMPGLDASNSNYLVRRHRDGGGRKDLMTWGTPDGSAAYVRIELYRPGNEDMTPDDAFDAIAALASEAKMNAELTETTSKLITKFGELPVVEMVVTGAEGVRSCVAVSGAWENPRFGIVSWWCNSGPEMVPHGLLACLLDKLSLMSAGGDDRLAQFFAKAELQRNFCGAPGPLVAATPKRRDDWMVTKDEPKLRGRIAGR